MACFPHAPLNLASGTGVAIERSHAVATSGRCADPRMPHNTAQKLPAVCGQLPIGAQSKEGRVTALRG
jgi:hypothetical protein